MRLRQCRRIPDIRREPELRNRGIRNAAGRVAGSHCDLGGRVASSLARTPINSILGLHGVAAEKRPQVSHPLFPSGSGDAEDPVTSLTVSAIDGWVAVVDFADPAVRVEPLIGPARQEPARRCSGVMQSSDATGRPHSPCRLVGSRSGDGSNWRPPLGPPDFGQQLSAKLRYFVRRAGNVTELHAEFSNPVPNPSPEAACPP